MNNQIAQIAQFASKIELKKAGIAGGVGFAVAVIAYKAKVYSKINIKVMEISLALHAKIVKKKMDVTVHANPSDEEIVAVTGDVTTIYFQPVTIKNLTEEEIVDMTTDTTWLESVIVDNNTNQVYRMVTEDGLNKIVVIAKMKV